MKERTSAYVAIAILLGLIGSSAWYSVRSNVEDLHYVPNEHSPDFKGQDVMTVRFDAKGEAASRFEADSVHHFADGRMFAINPKTHSFSKDKPATVASGGTAYSTDGGIVFTIVENVVVAREASATAPATVLKTDRLVVDTAKNTYATDGHVLITQGLSQTEGTGMVLDNARQTLKLTSKVKSVFYPKNTSVDLLRK